MLDSPPNRTEREIALAVFGVSIETFDSWVLDRLAALLDEQPVRAGQVLWSRGEAVEHIFFMPKGRVRATRKGAAPWTFAGRWFLGGFEGYGNRTAERDLVALEDFAVLNIRRQGWLDLLEDSFEMTHRTVVGAAAAVAALDLRVPTTDPLTILSAPPVQAQPMTILDRITFLSGLPMATAVGVQAMADVADIADEVVLAPGDTLFAEGVAPERFFFVVDGSIAAARRNPEVHRQYGRSELVAGPAALSDHARQWAARAGTTARLLAIPHEAWFDLMEEHFQLAEWMMATLAIERERIISRLAADAGPQGVVLT